MQSSNGATARLWAGPANGSGCVRACGARFALSLAAGEVHQVELAHADLPWLLLSRLCLALGGVWSVCEFNTMVILKPSASADVKRMAWNDVLANGTPAASQLCCPPLLLSPIASVPNCCCIPDLCLMARPDSSAE